MQNVSPKLSFSVCEENSGGIPVIIVSAGSSSRMGGINKQFIPICSVPVIARTLSAFEKSDRISRIILVCRQEDVVDMQIIAQQYNITKLTDIVNGGDERRDSVLNGFKMLTAEEKKVLIHDGARPFVDNAVIEDAVGALETDDACICAVKIIDTVKRSDDNGYVAETVSRDLLYSVQTPQGVDVDKYLNAIKMFPRDSVTDDASLMEKAGYRVRIVDGNRKNIKITTPDDIEFAEIIVRGFGL